MNRRRNGTVRLADIAKVTGFSGATVSLALNNNPRLPPETIRRVQEAAGKLGYVSPRRKRESLGRGHETGKCWCLLFPYHFEHYDYTELDLFIINTLEKLAMEHRASLQISRLDQNNRFPQQVRNTFFNCLFIKSHELPGKAKAPEIYRGNPVTFFGFSSPQGGIPDVTPDYAEAVRLIFDAMRLSECRRIVIPQPNYSESEHFTKQLNALKKLAAENAMRLSLISGAGAEIIQEAVNAVRSSREKTAFVSLRKSGWEQSIAGRIVEAGIVPGTEMEFFIEEFDHRKMNRPEFNYIDLRGEDIIRSAVELMSAPYHPTATTMLLQPRLLKATQSGPRGDRK